jgi:1-acyl-sn-glycerol-3-phosphate acyltransferase
VELALRKIVIEGRGNVPKKGGYIIASNHVSVFDPVAIGYAIWRCSKRPINYMAKGELGQIKIIKSFLEVYHTVFIKREQAERLLLKQITEILNREEIIIIFPQQSSILDKQKIKSGVGYLAIASQKPVLPVAVKIIGYERRKGFFSFLWMTLKWFFWHGLITIKFGPLIYCKSEQNRRSITQDVMHKISSLLNPSWEADSSTLTDIY